jgi:hypothetical protein
MTRPDHLIVRADQLLMSAFDPKRTRRPLCGYPHRGFESHPLRHMALILLRIFDWQAINPRFDIASALAFSVGMGVFPRIGPGNRLPRLCERWRPRL